MTKVIRKWWLVAALLCLTPGAPAQQCAHGCVQAPEGGSAPIYVLGVGMVCLGAILIRSRTSN